MKKIINVLIIAFLTGIFVFVKFSSAQEVDKKEINFIVSHLRSKDVKVQFKGIGKILTMGKKGFEIIKKYRTIPEIKDAMFDLFVYYSTVPRNKTSKLIFCGDGSNYHCLLGVIGDFNDLRTLPYLLKNMSAGVTVRSLAKLGKPALVPVLKKLESGKIYEKRKAARVLGLMVEEKEEGFIPQSEDRKKIKNALLTALVDKDSSKIHIVHALGKLKDKDLLPVFEKLAKEDTLVREQKDRSGEMIKKYPVREEAKKAIEKLKQSK